MEQLIATRQAEAAATEAAKAQAQLFNQTAATALDSLIVKGNSLSDVLRNVASSFLQAAIQAATLGTGPFGAVFGGVGLFGVQARAAGGMIYGPGGPTDDQVPFLASAGEFVVNAAATARNRPELEAMNAGAALGRFARGGMVGGGGGGGAGAGPVPTVNFHFDYRGVAGDSEIRRIAEESTARGVREGLKYYDRVHLPESVGRIQQNPRRIG